MSVSHRSQWVRNIPRLLTVSFPSCLSKPSLLTVTSEALFSTVFSGPHTGGALRDVKCEKKKIIYKCPKLYSFAAIFFLYSSLATPGEHPYIIHQLEKKRKIRRFAESSTFSPLFATSHKDFDFCKKKKKCYFAAHFTCLQGGQRQIGL